MNKTWGKVKREPNPNPVTTANPLSKFTFWWLRDLFRKGFKAPLDENELYDNIPGLNSKGLTNKFNKLWDEELRRENPSIARVLYRAYGTCCIISGLLFSFAETSTRIAQPLCLGGLVSYFAQKENGDVSKQSAYLYALGIVICSLIPVLVFHQYIFYIFTIGTKVRLACSGLIYQKALRISKTSSNEGLSGRAINILSNDLGKFDIAFCFIHDLWKGPIEAVLIGYCMYLQIGVSAVIGVAFMLSFIPLQAWGAKKAAYYRQKTAERTDLRVKLMNEIIQGIQVIKMYAWEKSFAVLVDKVRRKEINAVKGTVYIHAGLYSTTMISRVSIFLSLVSYVYLGDLMTAKQVFIVTSYFYILNDSMVRFWPMAITFCAEAYISARRVKEFLLEPEGKRKYAPQPYTVNGNLKFQNGSIISNGEIQKNDISIDEIKPKRELNEKGIVLENVSASWTPEEGASAAGVENLNIEILGKKLCAVVGPVGSGKSTLLNVMVGELEIDKGQMHTNGVLSYACQEPWIFESTVRENIVFIEEYDEVRYNEVIRVCGLQKDLELFPHGDLTIVGERGVSLSGGQKARVHLARAIYKQADIYILDDPLSAVDTHVGKHIFENCIKGFLKNKTCILVTHQLQYLKAVEHLILIAAGRVEIQGSYQEIQDLDKFTFFAAQAHDEAGDQEETVDKKFENITKTEVKKPTEDTGEDRKELQAIGSVGFSVYKSYFKAINSCTAFASMVALFLIARVLLTGVDYFISRWVIWEESVTLSQNQTSLVPNDTNISYLETNTTLSSNVWTSLIEAERQTYVMIYTVILGLALVFYLLRTFGFFLTCLRISLSLHDKLFRGITRAAMQFFNTNPSGRILNRFSKDIHSVDTILPETMIDCFSFFVDLASVLIIVAVANYWLLIPAAVVALLFYLVRIIYINTGRSIKRIESMSRSPVYSHTNQTFQGLTTIRALKAQEVLEMQFHEHQNYNASPWYLFLATARAFAFWLDMICVVYIGVVTYSFLLLSEKAYSGDVGLAIMQCVNMVGMCQWGMRQTAELENHMTSVERILEYAEQKPEPPLETLPKYRPPAEWPDKGKLEFENVRLKYSEDSDYILRDLNFTIQPNEKIGIVGRTGAGKSSIIQAIFRLATNEGAIMIDGIDTSTLGLHDLRSKVSIIPQDPVLFSGTLRFNLDPFDEKTDTEMWNALEEVELKAHVSNLIGGLNCKMSDGGSNFSMGQRQLVCLARAILRNNKLLILDEATANVDPETDKLIQTTIRKKFAECTVLTIAHRLHTVMDSDKVLVIDAGRAVEFGHPHELLQKSGGFLRKLVDQTGHATATILIHTAESNYNDKSLNQNENRIP